MFFHQMLNYWYQEAYWILPCIYKMSFTKYKYLITRRVLPGVVKYSIKYSTTSNKPGTTRNIWSEWSPIKYSLFHYIVRGIHPSSPPLQMPLGGIGGPRLGRVFGVFGVLSAPCSAYPLALIITFCTPLWIQFH
jgi:hypothetical protein